MGVGPKIWGGLKGRKILFMVGIVEKGQTATDVKVKMEVQNQLILEKSYRSDVRKNWKKRGRRLFRWTTWK